MAGVSEGSVKIDFPFLEESDKKGDSFYVVGGRAYFEADAIGRLITSYTAKGFFDKLGYIEPESSRKKKTGIILGITIAAGVVIIGGTIVYCWWKKKKEKSSHVE